jgi:CMP-N-acetylneuraminic acid synthetase
MNTPNAVPRIVALVPMRHESERVPGKNYRSFAGQPLYRRIINSLLSCGSIQGILIDTDSPTITEDVSKYYPQIQLLKRPDHLRGGDIPMNKIILHDIEQMQADYYLQTHSTNPLLTGETISRAIEAFFDNRDQYDSLFSVTRLRVRLWNSSGKPINHDPSLLLRTQDLPPVYMENSSLYLFSRESMLAYGNRIGQKPLMLEIDQLEAWDIDEETDFLIAEMLYKRQMAEGDSLA